jgi:hypothetical protein
MEEHDGDASLARSGSPDIFGPLPPRKVTTYAGSTRARRLAAAQNAAEKALAEHSAESRSTKSTKSRPRKSYPPRSRQSARIRGEYSPGGMTLTQVKSLRVVMYAPLPESVLFSFCVASDFDFFL